MKQQEGARSRGRAAQGSKTNNTHRLMGVVAGELRFEDKQLGTA
jgi:hypothetical protein